MESLKVALRDFILNPRHAEALTLIKAARNGAVYGAKVRFPHALVMVFLFRSGSFRDKVEIILKATRQHAYNLARFAFTYKLVMMLLRHAPTRGGLQGSKEASIDSFLAGLVGGYLVFGRGIQSSVNQQIVIYVFARVALGLAKLGAQQGNLLSNDSRNPLAQNAWPVFAATSWAAVMWLFRWHPDVLQPSLRSSMKYIYQNADHWDSLRNFFIHNT